MLLFLHKTLCLKTRRNKMDKKILKEVLTSLTAGQEVEVNFRGNLVNQNGTYSVVESKADRGKMGSRKAILRSASGTEVTLHTKTNADVLNLVVNGTMFGSADETGEPRVFPKDLARGMQLRDQFRILVEGQRVSLTSEVEPAFNGNFQVVSVSPVRGKFQQMCLKLQNDGGSTIEVFSYRHSTVITSFTVEPMPVVATVESTESSN